METTPQIISMENVPNLIRKDIFNNFVQFLKDNKYFVSYQIVYCPDYGIPQKRKRLVLLASKLGEINLIPPTHKKDEYVSVVDVLGKMEKISAG